LLRHAGEPPADERHPLDDLVARGCVHPTASYVQAVCHLQQGADVRIGQDSIICGSIHLHRPARFHLGARSYVGHDSAVHVAESTVIGDDVMISWGCTLIDTDMHSLHFSERSNDVLITGGRNGLSAKDKDWSVVPCAPITIKNKAWIGMHTIILKGVTVGEGAVVAAGSLVSADVPPWTLVAGRPARVIRTFSDRDRTVAAPTSDERIPVPAGSA